MDTLDILRDPTAVWKRRPPAERTVIQQLVAASKKRLPDEYITLLQYSNGGEGELGIEPGWFQIWSAEEVIEFNQTYGIEENLPGFFGFGSNGDGKLLAFDMRGSERWKVVMVPFIPMRQEEAILIADCFQKFVQSMGRVLRVENPKK